MKDRLSLKAAITKNKKVRTIFICSKLQKELVVFFEHRLAPLDLTEPLLKSQKGSHFSANSLCQWFSSIYDEAGIYAATSHSGRRTFITKLASGGVNPRIIMELAGHSSLSTTQKYIEIEDAAIARAVEIL